MNEFDIVIGHPSIFEIISFNTRKIQKIFFTEDSKKEFLKRFKKDQSFLKGIEIEILDSHRLEEEAKKYFDELNFSYQRVPSKTFAIVDKLKIYDPAWLFDELLSGKIDKILCLDQITDIHNGAAILRTASFYGVDTVVVSMKNNFGHTPSFSRIASGGLEHVKIVKCASLPKFITKLQKSGVRCFGLSEHASEELKDSEIGEKNCLILGAEDVGLSNAVTRILDKTLSLKALGNTKSLNVSVAAALAMDKVFNS